MELKPGGLKIWHTLVILPFLLLLQFFYGFITAAVAYIFRYPFEKDLLLLGLNNLISFGLVVFLCVLIFRIPWRRIFPVKRIPGIVYPFLLLTVFGLMILSSELDNILRYFFHIATDPTILKGIQYNPWGAALTLIVIAPLTEETLFRGVICQGFKKQYSASIAIAFSAFFFGAIHLNWQQAPGAFILGLLLGWMILRTGSIIPSLLIHAFNNGLVFLATLININIPGFSDGPATGPVFQPFWFDAMGFLLFVIGFWTLIRILPRPKPVDAAPTITMGFEN